VTAGREEPLFEIDAFTWYVFDAVYDVARGPYDLTVFTEGRARPVVSLQEQPNVLGIPGSQLRKFSFIGDVPGRDRSNARFFVDDIVITSDLPVSETPFVAPGRRMLFVDIHDYYQRRLREHPECVPALGYEDFDLSPADLAELVASGLKGAIEPIEPIEGDDAELSRSLSPFLRGRLAAMRDWREGCRGGERSVELFRRAKRAAPAAKIYPMSEVLALVAEKRWREADSLFLSIYSQWQDDPRFSSISASIGLARGDLEEAESWLSSWTEAVPRKLGHPLVRRLWSGDIDPELVLGLQTAFPSEWPDLVRTALSAELRFYVLSWQGRYREAGDYAGRMGALLRRMEIEPSRWIERQGDAAFYDGDYVEARKRYEEALALAGRDDGDDVLLKLSDTHFKLGNFDLERLYRERIYGSLRSP
jgi:tetratricopeptide (TPR) repeat protein